MAYRGLSSISPLSGPQLDPSIELSIAESGQLPLKSGSMNSEYWLLDRPHENKIFRLFKLLSRGYRDRKRINVLDLMQPASFNLYR